MPQHRMAAGGQWPEPGTSGGVSVMKFSEMVGRSQVHNGNDPLDMRKLKPVTSLTEKLLCSQPNHAAEHGRESTDHLVQGLLDRLPKPDGVWALEDRARWLRTAACIFDLVYKAGDGDQGDIRVALVSQESPTRLAQLSANSRA